jgi:hypothetical protein
MAKGAGKLMTTDEGEEKRVKRNRRLIQKVVEANARQTQKTK